jgi:hypothetical protein
MKCFLSYVFSGTEMISNVLLIISFHGSDSCYVAFHDEEWGVPVHDDRYVN